MPSALQAQLAKAASANAGLLADRDRRGKRRVHSYLFSARDADAHDLSTLHALGLNGFTRLVVLNVNFNTFEDALFSHASRDTDRTLLDQATVNELNGQLDAFLLALSPYLLDAAAGKVIEWLVRRFRVNEFNVPAVLQVFLPYHESPHFAKMLSILDIEKSAAWSFLVPFKTAAKSLPRAALVSEMRKTIEIARFVAGIVPAALRQDCISDALVSFNASVWLDYFASIDSRVLNDETMAFILPAFFVPLKHTIPTQNTVMGSLLLLAAMSQKCTLSADALGTILSSIAKAKRLVSPVQLITTFVAVCGPQDELAKLSSKVVDILVTNSDAFPDVLQLDHCERLFAPFIQACVADLEESKLAALQTIIQTPSTPPQLIRVLSLGAYEQLATDLTNASLSGLLSSIRQRHPQVLDDCLKQQRETHGDDVTNSLIRAIQHPDTQMTTDDADAEVRVAAVRELINSIESGATEGARTALLARVTDPNVDVVAALYRSPDALLKAVPLRELIAAIAAALDMPEEIPRSALRAHLAFVGAHGTAEDVSRVFWRWALITGSRKKRTAVAWEVLSESSPDKLGLFKGCAVLETDDDAQRNGAIAKRIAENIIAAPSLEPHLDFLFEMFHHTDSHSRLLASLVLRALLQNLKDSHRLDLAARLCDTPVNCEDWPTDAAAFHEYIGEAAQLKAVAGKPSKAGTTNRMHAALFALLLDSSLPSGSHADWFAPPKPESSEHVDKYITLMRAVYAVPSAALRALLLKTLGGEALLFLAGVSMTTPTASTRLAALKHASAFVAASAEADGQLRWDLQVVLPAVLAALVDEDVRVRTAASEVLPPAGGHDPKAVYGYDDVYGSKTELVQYLDWDDVTKFLGALHIQKVSLAQDASLLPYFLQHALGRAKTDAKRDTQYKQHVLCFLCSHIAASTHAPFQVRMLQALRGVADVAKVGVLRPLVAEVFESANGQIGDVQLKMLVAGVFDAAAASAIEEDEALRTEYFDLLERCATDNIASLHILISNIQSGLYAALESDVQLELATALLRVGMQSSNSEVYTAIRNTISNVVAEPTQVVALLERFRPVPAQSSSVEERAAKRVKTTNVEPESKIQSLILLAEALSSQNRATIPAQTQPRLIFVLLETLKALATVPNANYAQQLIMNVLEHCADASPKILLAGPGSGSNAIRLEVIVDIIRSVDNPQTFHQALLLFAKMARLAPESAVFNIMPVFTFMGSSVVLRDDANSFRVVHKTLEAIVPVMLQIAARPLLKVLTDAATHVPRHRRTMFFTQLVQHLGPAEFLEPVCLLLADAHAKKVLRHAQDRDDLHNTLSLPLTIMAHFSAQLRVTAVVAALQECQALLRIAISDSSAKAFLYQPSAQAEGSVSPSGAAKKQAYAVLLFLREVLAALRSKAGDKTMTSSLGECIPLLVNLYAATIAQDQNDPAVVVLSGMLVEVLALAPAKTFIASAIELLSQADAAQPGSKLLHSILELLIERIPMIASTVRAEISFSVKSLIANLAKVLSRSVSGSAAIRGHVLALRALAAVATSSISDEANALSGLVPKAIEAGKTQGVTKDALILVAKLVPKLGPRMVPHFNAVVQFCGSAAGPNDREAVQEVFTSFLMSLSSFWGPAELDAVLSLTLQEPVDAYKTLRRQIAKKVPGDVLLPALFETWTNGSTKTDEMRSANEVVAFFDLVKLALQTAFKDVVMANLKGLTKLHISAFDLRNSHTAAPLAEFEGAAENATITSFVQLVIKLNEVSFTPVFRQLYDWAFAEDTPLTRTRKITFTRTVSTLLETFKGLMDPYVLLIMDGIVELLDILSTERDTSPTTLGLWSNTVTLVRKSLVAEDSSYWRDDRVRKILPALVAQTASPVALRNAETQKTLSDTMVALARTSSDSNVLKDLNDSIFAQAKHEDVRVRLRAVGIAEALWKDDGAGMTEFSRETEVFVDELAEDDDEDVCKAARRLARILAKLSGDD
ncbi:armadillo-type protein [Auriculariales sp. MPI-PUGE-AT-0066]|nr:armadillo-type protein [Auriculariales sp. MPI-PUGE-AT-0066]